MMDINIDYLKDYGFTDDNLDALLDRMEELEIDLYNINCKVKNNRDILYFLVTNGVRNLFDIVYATPRIFDYECSEIEEKFKNYGNIEELVDLLNEDPKNLSLINII